MWCQSTHSTFKPKFIISTTCAMIQMEQWPRENPTNGYTNFSLIPCNSQTLTLPMIFYYTCRQEPKTAVSSEVSSSSSWRQIQGPTAKQQAEPGGSLEILGIDVLKSEGPRMPTESTNMGPWGLTEPWTPSREHTGVGITPRHICSQCEAW